jgi:hypothetical protein
LYLDITPLNNHIAPSLSSLSPLQQQLSIMADTKKKVNPLLPMSAGCIAGGIEACAVWPMEYIKVSFFSHFRSADRFSVFGFDVFYYAL